MTRSASGPGDPNFSGVVVYEPPWITTIKSVARRPFQAFKQRKKEQIYASSKRKYSVMSKIIRHQSEEETDRGVHKAMRHAAVILAEIDLSNKQLLRACSLIVVPIVIPLYYQGWPLTRLFAHHDNLMIALALLIIAGITIIIGTVGHTSNNWVPFTYAIVAIISGVIVYARSPGEFNRLWHITPHVNGWPYLFFILMAFSLYMSIVAIPFIILIVQLTRRRILRRCPDYAATEQLGFALEHLAMRGIKASSLDNRNHAIIHLENAAFLINNGVPRKLTASNMLAQSTLRERCALAAEAIRELEIKVAFADMGDLEEIRKITTHVVTAICLGTYDIHPQGNLSQVPHLSLTRKIRHASRTLLIGIIPIAVIISLRYGGIKLSSQFNNWAVAIAILWAVIVFVSALDPLYTSRLKAVQDFVSAFRGGAS